MSEVKQGNAGSTTFVESVFKESQNH